MAAGEQTLFEECQTCFEAMGKNSFYLGDVGNASKMNLILQMLAGVSIAAVAEALSLGLCSNIKWFFIVAYRMKFVFQGLINVICI